MPGASADSAPGTAWPPPAGRGPHLPRPAPRTAVICPLHHARSPSMLPSTCPRCGTRRGPGTPSTSCCQPAPGTRPASLAGRASEALAPDQALIAIARDMREDLAHLIRLLSAPTPTQDGQAQELLRTAMRIEARAPALMAAPSGTPVDAASPGPVSARCSASLSTPLAAATGPSTSSAACAPSPGPGRPASGTNASTRPGNCSPPRACSARTRSAHASKTRRQHQHYRHHRYLPPPHAQR